MVSQKEVLDKKFILSYVPENLYQNIENHEKIFFKGQSLKVPYIIDITHILIRKHFQTGFTSFNLESRILRDKYGSKYNYYLDYLCHKKIIHMVSNYQSGKKSRSYLLDDTTLKHLNIIKNRDNVLLKKYRKLYSIDYLRKINYQYIPFDVMKKLVNYLDRVSIDYEKAQNYILDLNLPENQKIKNIHSILSLKEKNIWYNFDNYGRLHTNFTTLKSDIRDQHLLIDNEQTKEIDIVNSQPIFLSILLSKNLNEVNKEEYLNFKELVLTGNLYNYISSNFGRKNKKETKKVMYTVLFGTNHLNKKENKIFNELFPSIFNFIKKYKKKNGTYKALAYNLQRSESKFVFSEICKEIIHTYPGLPFFTVHDSITVKKSDYNKVKKIFDVKINQLHSMLEF